MAVGFMPDAINKNIPPGDNDPAIVPVGVALHVAVYEGLTLRNIFLNRGGIEAHFYIRYDGTIEQYRSIFYEADAQTEGNSFTLNGKRCGIVSVETEGWGTGQWTPAQISSIKRIIRYVDSISDVAKVQCPTWNSSGIGYHSLFKEWNPLSKSCPGADRIVQYKEIILPWWKRQAVAELTRVGRARREIVSACNRALDEIPKKRVFARGRIQATKLVAKTIPRA